MSESDACVLSPQARAFSTVLTAFVGSIINGVASGAFVAFLTGWIAWLAPLRVLCGALYDFYLTLSTDVESRPDNKYFERWSETDLTAFGWLCWLWSTLYTPISATLWLAANWNLAAGELKLVKALGISVAGLRLIFDTRCDMAPRSKMQNTVVRGPTLPSSFGTRGCACTWVSSVRSFSSRRSST